VKALWTGVRFSPDPPKGLFMNEWTDTFPPLNLWNYNLSWAWHIDPELESFFDGSDRFRHGEITKEATQ